MVDGLPATPVNVNLVGLRRKGWSDDEIRAARDVFRQLFKDRDGTPAAQIVAQIRATPAHEFPCVRRLCDWMEAHLEQSVKGRLQESLR
jgi:acyl-[acyl carrier protein]--UDP-N-acetylglucosamine O-acyltransferase